MPVDRAALAYAVGNVSSSVALVLINKWVFSGGFRFPMTLTFFHFVFTDLFYRSLAAAGLFVRKSMPFADAFRCSSPQPRTAASPSRLPDSRHRTLTPLVPLTDPAPGWRRPASARSAS